MSSADLIGQLEASLAVPVTDGARSTAETLASTLAQIHPHSDPHERENAVRGLLALNSHFYRDGDLDRTRHTLSAALNLSADLAAATRVSVLLRCGDFEMLIWDIGAALAHSAAAMGIAQTAGLRVEEARIWTNYGMALQAAGLMGQADARLAHALTLLDGLDEPRVAGNIWTLRSHLGIHLDVASLCAAEHACAQALHFARISPPRHRDSMVCTALCNRAAQAVLAGEAEQARASLDEASGLTNLGMRPRWLLAVIDAMLTIRLRHDDAAHEHLLALLAPERAPARAYVIETWSILASLYTTMGDGERAYGALVELSQERARALWAMLSDPHALDATPTGGSGVFPRMAASMGMLERLAVTSELRDDATGKHCFRVGRLSMILAQQGGLQADECRAIEMAARLHDIGKFAIPDAILLKPGRLSEAESRLMRTHASIGADLLASAVDPVILLAEKIARHHHEHWDGSGYPEGSAGEEIPYAARVAALADVYDALTHTRPYKEAWTHDAAVAYIASRRGTQFDPQLTDAFLIIMTEASRNLGVFVGQLENEAAASPYVAAEETAARALQVALG